MNEFFSIFNPDWWADENNNALQMTDWVFIKPLSKLAAYLKKDAREIENKYIQISDII